MNSLVCIWVPTTSGGKGLGGKLGASWSKGSKLGASWSKPNVILGFRVPTTIGGKTSLHVGTSFSVPTSSDRLPSLPAHSPHSSLLPALSSSLQLAPSSLHPPSSLPSLQLAPACSQLSPASQLAPACSQLSPASQFTPSAGRAKWISRFIFWCPHYMSAQASVCPPVLIGSPPSQLTPLAPAQSQLSPAHSSLLPALSSLPAHSPCSSLLPALSSLPTCSSSLPALSSLPACFSLLPALSSLPAHSQCR